MACIDVLAQSIQSWLKYFQRENGELYRQTEYWGHGDFDLQHEHFTVKSQERTHTVSWLSDIDYVTEQIINKIFIFGILSDLLISRQCATILRTSEYKAQVLGESGFLKNVDTFHQLMHKWTVLKTILKLTLNQH